MSEDNISRSEQPSEKSDPANQGTKRVSIISRALFLDVFFNRQTRPVFIYAAIMIGVGAALYHWLEGWGWLDSVYFVIITLTTIGYGDLYPTTPATKLITIFYGVNGIILILLLFDIIRKLRGWDIGNAKKTTKDKDDG